MYQLRALNDEMQGIPVRTCCLLRLREGKAVISRAQFGRCAELFGLYQR